MSLLSNFIKNHTDATIEDLEYLYFEAKYLSDDMTNMDYVDACEYLARAEINNFLFKLLKRN